MVTMDTISINKINIIFRECVNIFQKFIYDFKSLSVELEVSPDEEFTPANETLALLLDEDYELTTENAKYMNTYI